MRAHVIAVVAFAGLLCAPGCALTTYPEGDPYPISPQSDVCGDPDVGNEELCLPDERLRTLLQSGELRVMNHYATTGGLSGASKMRLMLIDARGRLVVHAKWKEAPPDGEELNNEPRKELAAYALQRLLFAPDEYVVPPTVIRCIPLDEIRWQEPVQEQPQSRGSRVLEMAPTVPGTRCKLGVLSYWIPNVQPLGELDVERFAEDPGYADNVARLNIFTFLMDHHDAHQGNFMMSSDLGRPRVFSVDNGLAFSGLKNPRMMFGDDFDEVLVPGIPSDLVRRLRGLDRAALARALGTVAQLEPVDGVLVPVDPEPPWDASEGVRWRGRSVQFGLDEDEIDDIHERLGELIEEIDEHRLEQLRPDHDDDDDD